MHILLGLHCTMVYQEVVKIHNTHHTHLACDWTDMNMHRQYSQSIGQHLNQTSPGHHAGEMLSQPWCYSSVTSNSQFSAGVISLLLIGKHENTPVSSGLWQKTLTDNFLIISCFKIAREKHKCADHKMIS